ncbi:MAG: TolC family protein [Bacteroidota bacterium]
MKTQYTLLFILLLIVGFAKGQNAESYQWTLQECVDYALENSLDVQRNVLNLQDREINYDQAKWSRYPNLNGSTSYGPNWGRSINPNTNLFVNQRINSARANLNSSVTLFNGLNIRNTIKQTEYAFEASKQDLETSKNNVILNVINFYTNVLFTRELYENALSQVESTKEQVELTRKQVEAGALPRANLLDLQAQMATNEVNAINQENSLILAKIQLKQLLQLPPESQIDIVVPEIEVGAANDLPNTAIEVYEIALASMPEIKSADYNIKSAERGVQASKGSLYPTVSLNAGLSTNYSDLVTERFIPDAENPLLPVTDGIGNQLYEPTDLRTVSGGEAIESAVFIPNGEVVDFGFSEQFDENLSQFVTISLSVPVFNGFSAKANVQRAEITKRRAEITYKDTRYQLWQTIEQAYNDVKAASKSYEASLKAVEAREEAFRVTEKQKAAGAINATDYEIAENNLYQAKTDLTRAKYDYIFKLKILDFYQGKPLEF